MKKRIIFGSAILLTSLIGTSAWLAGSRSSPFHISDKVPSGGCRTSQGDILLDGDIARYFDSSSLEGEVRCRHGELSLSGRIEFGRPNWEEDLGRVEIGGRINMGCRNASICNTHSHERINFFQLVCNMVGCKPVCQKSLENRNLLSIPMDTESKAYFREKLPCFADPEWDVSTPKHTFSLRLREPDGYEKLKRVADRTGFPHWKGADGNMLISIGSKQRFDRIIRLLDDTGSIFPFIREIKLLGKTKGGMYSCDQSQDCVLYHEQDRCGLNRVEVWAINREFQEEFRAYEHLLEHESEFPFLEESCLDSSSLDDTVTCQDHHCTWDGRKRP